MSRHRRPVIRFIVALLATTVAIAPGLASIIDAKPAARGVMQRFASHAEETGRQHELRAHVDDCALCQLATRSSSERPATPQPTLVVAPAPIADRCVPFPQTPDERWTALCRGPPIG